MDHPEPTEALKSAHGSTKITETVVCPTCGIRLSSGISMCPNDKTVLTNNSGLGANLSRQYEMIEEIGSGGMGVIYKARHMALDILVAIKMLHVNRLDEVAMQRFAQEAKAISLLDHRGIVKIRDYGGTESGQPYMVLDYVDANTLEQHIAWQGPRSVEESLNIFWQAADALAHAHERGILHRDIKPSNIMVSEHADGSPSIKIVDFGIAKLIDSSTPESKVTKTGEVFGSPLYMSPEQASGKPLDACSDIYSLACVMYETLTGAPPFTGKNPIEILTSQINDDPPTLRDGSLGTVFPTNLEAIIKKALSKDPRRRFQSMAQFRTALEIAQQGRELPLEEEQKAEIEVAEQKNKATFWWAVATMLVTCLVVVGFWWSTHDRIKPSTPLSEPDLGILANIGRNDAANEIAASRQKKSIDLSVFLDVDDKTLSQFDNLSETEDINLEHSSVKGDGLAHLIHLPLKNLDLDYSQTGDRGCLDIAHMSHLEDLTLSNTQVTDEGLKNIGQVRTLSRLHLSGDHLTGKAIVNLQRLPKLQVLSFAKNSFDAEGAAELGKFPELQALFLNDSTLDKDALKSLKDCQKLTLLSLARTNVSPHDLSYLTGIDHVGILSLEGCHSLDGLDCAIFKNMKALQNLNIAKINISEKTLAELKDTRVSSLDLTATNLTDKGLAILSDNKRLFILNISHCANISQQAKDAFRQRRPNCRLLNRQPKDKEDG